MSARRALVVAVCLVLLASPAAAHVPAFVGGNDSPGNAYRVPDPVKSWSFYDRLDRGGVAYYRLDLDAGERLHVSLFTPTRGAFTPSAVLLSPQLDGTDDVPDGVTVPDGYGTERVVGERPSEPEYEPFTPTANYHTLTIDRQVEESGTYLVAIYEPSDRAGPLGVAVGQRESFSPTEFVTVPLDQLGIYHWEGQHPLVVFGPAVAVLLGGLALLGRRRESLDTRATLLGVGALLYLATAATVAVQVGLTLVETGPTAGAIATLALVAIPAALGGWLFRRLLDGLAWTRATRLLVSFVGIGGLVTWSGFVVGPLVVFGAAVAPPWQDG